VIAAHVRHDDDDAHADADDDADDYDDADDDGADVGDANADVADVDRLVVIIIVCIMILRYRHCISSRRRDKKCSDHPPTGHVSRVQTVGASSSSSAASSSS
jgi:hypothetical protein